MTNVLMMVRMSDVRLCILHKPRGEFYTYTHTHIVTQNTLIVHCTGTHPLVSQARPFFLTCTKGTFSGPNVKEKSGLGCKTNHKCHLAYKSTCQCTSDNKDLSFLDRFLVIIYFNILLNVNLDSQKLKLAKLLLRNGR